MAKPKSILVAGDYIVDNHIYEGERKNYVDDKPGVRVVKEVGGAGLISKILRSYLIERNESTCGIAARCIEPINEYLKKSKSGKIPIPNPLNQMELNNEWEKDIVNTIKNSRRSSNKAFWDFRSPLSIDSDWMYELLAAANDVYQARTPKDQETIDFQFLFTVLDSNNKPQSTDQCDNAYAFWRPCTDKGEDKKEEVFWRGTERMGFGVSSTQPSSEDLTDLKITDESFEDAHVDVVVISDGGMGFRDNQKEIDTIIKRVNEETTIILKLSDPFCEGKVWETLTGTEAKTEKLTVVVAAEDLRKTSAKISFGLSWDSTIRDLVIAIKTDALLTQFLEPKRSLVVTFGSEGAIRIRKDRNGCISAVFVFDPFVVENEHFGDSDGESFGLLSCMTAAIAVQECDDNWKEDGSELEMGLNAIYDLMKNGHGVYEKGNLPAGFPDRRLAKRMHILSRPLSRLRLHFDDTFGQKSKVSSVSNPKKRPWSLFGQGFKQPEDVLLLASLYTQRGNIAIANIPQFQIGKLTAIDPAEIEDLRIIKGMVSAYCKQDNANKPLSLGVFGPPGSGKSFAVKEIATSLCSKESWLEFNLSQFSGPDDLIGAFHQIRDKALSGTVPVAFFDEFDSQKLKWLQYLLAPMQDGCFQEGQVTHPIGKCIMIFAGGTSWTFETFGPPSNCDQTEFRLAKGPDFKSRLDAFLNISGPNQRVNLKYEKTLKQWVPEKLGGVDQVDSSDAFHPIRRAMMIRGDLRLDPKERLTIDSGILNAILSVDKLTHGSRSLTKILQGFKDSTSPGYVKSNLLPAKQLGMHTNADEFLALCAADHESFSKRNKSWEFWNKLKVDPDFKRIGYKIHESYLTHSQREKSISLDANKAFDNLGEHDQESNLAAAKRIPEVLKLINASSGPELPNTIELYLDLLASEEHRQWMEWHFEQGWTLGPVKCKTNKTHPLLVSYDELDEVDKNKDRNQVRNYPKFLE